MSPKVCPECDHVFQGNGWDGIDAHWKAKHGQIMPYNEAWPLIQSGEDQCEDFNQAAFRAVQETIQRSES